MCVTHIVRGVIAAGRRECLPAGRPLLGRGRLTRGRGGGERLVFDDRLAGGAGGGGEGEDVGAWRQGTINSHEFFAVLPHRFYVLMCSISCCFHVPFFVETEVMFLPIPFQYSFSFCYKKGINTVSPIRRFG